jgi:hypothetical protein
MSKELTKRQESKLLDAIGTLKRAAGIEDHWLRDEVVGGECCVRTKSEESFQILHNLLGQALSQGHTADYWRKRPGQRPHEQMGNARLELDVFLIGFPVTAATCNLVTERIQKLAQKLVAPGKREGP